MGIKDDLIFAMPADPEFNERLSLVKMLLPTVNIREPNPIDDINDYLYDMWITVISDFQVDQESRYAYLDIATAFDNQDPWEDEIEEIRRARDHVASWIEHAQARFNNLIKNIYITTANDADQFKHFSNIRWNEKYIISMSYKRAIISNVISNNDLDKMLCDIISQDIEAFSDSVHEEYLYQTKLNTGYSQGLSCIFLHYKISYSGKIAHSFPVNDNEVNRLRNRMPTIVSSIF